MNQLIGIDAINAPSADHKIGSKVDCIFIVSTAMTAIPIKVVAIIGNKIAAIFNMIGPFCRKLQSVWRTIAHTALIQLKSKRRAYRWNVIENVTGTTGVIESRPANS